MSYESHTRKQEMLTVFCLENSWKHISINSDNKIKPFTETRTVILFQYKDQQ